MKRFLSRRTHSYKDKNRLDDLLRGSVSRILQKTLINNLALLIVLAECLIPWFLDVHLPSDPRERKY